MHLRALTAISASSLCLVALPTIALAQDQPTTPPQTSAPAPLEPQAPKAQPTQPSPSETPAPGEPAPNAQSGKAPVAAPESPSAVVPPPAGAEAAAPQQSSDSPTTAPEAGNDATPPPEPADPAPAQTSMEPPADLTAPSVGAEFQTPPSDFKPGQRDKNEVDRDEALARYYALLYRPASNPARIYFHTSISFAALGNNEADGGGRAVNLRAAVGQTWNYIGYAVDVAMFGGALITKNGGDVYTPVLVGGGPTLNLGRLALMRRGFFDLRVGYDFYWGPGRARPEADAGFEAEDVSPHGPRLRISTGLLMQTDDKRKLRHGLGIDLGWQGLVGSFTGPYSYQNVINVGLSYFFG